MPIQLSRPELQQFLTRLGQVCVQPTRIYLFGGTALLLMGSPRHTAGVDYTADEPHADDVRRFLGHKLHGNFQGEVTTSLKRRREGRRVGHILKRNSLKWYDVLNVLRIETTLNNPREFRALRVLETQQGRQRRWRPLGKGVANFWRYAQVGRQANGRYLEAVAHAQPKGKAIAELDGLCQSRREKGKRYAKFNPVAAKDNSISV